MIKQKKWLYALRKWLLVSIGFYAVQAQAESPEDYRNATMQIDYQGSVGYLAQLLANKLNIGYYAYLTDPTLPVKVKQSEEQSLAHLLAEINRQLPSQTLRFEQNGEQVYLALTPQNVSLNLQIFPQNRPLVGDVKFANAEKKAKNVAPIFVEPALLPVEKTDESKVDAKAALDASTPPKALSEEERASREQIMQAIVSQSQDTKVMAQYAKRKQPMYKVEDKATLKLESIKSTKISTFLVFQQGVDLEPYTINGKFQEIVKLDNLVAILHRQEAPPQEIIITLPNGKVQTIRKTN